MDRYIPAETAARERMTGLPKLVRLAWDIALIYPELGDEIIADLIADIRTIVDREERRMADEARTAAESAARESWHDRFRRHSRRTADMVAAFASGITADGINPHGWYVYLLWPEKGAETPVYVGRSGNLLSRLGSHMGDWERRHQTGWITVIECDSEAAMIETEGRLIGRYRPRLNTYGVQ